MRTAFMRLSIVALALSFTTVAVQASPVDLPRFPSVSPDGSTIAFSWRGDLWSVSATGGDARRLTAHVANDHHSAWSPDGTTIAFESARDGYQNLYLMDVDGGNVRQVTDTDRGCTLWGFGQDEHGRAVLTLSGLHEGDVYRSHRPYQVSVGGGDILRIHDAFGSQPAVSPDGRRVVFTRGGYYYGWPRRHYDGAENMDVFVYDRTDGSFRRLTSARGHDGNARWLDDDTIVFMSDRTNSIANLYRLDIDRDGATPVQITDFSDDPVKDFDVSADGSTAVMVVWDTIYTMNLAGRNATPRPISVSAGDDEQDRTKIVSVGQQVSEAALSPDGKVMATVAYGEIFVRHVDDDSPTVRVTDHHARDRQIAWSPDGLRLYFVSDRDGTESIYEATVALTRSDVKSQYETEDEESDEDNSDNNGDDDAEADADGESTDDEGDADGESDDADGKGDDEAEGDLPPELDPSRWHDAIRFTITPVVATAENDRMPSPSPDGSALAFRRGRGDLMVMDLESGDAHALVEWWDTSMTWRWSPDGSWIAYTRTDMNFNDDVFMVPADGSADPINITKHPDSDVSPRFSADGRVLAFLSERVNEETDVWMVALDETLESYTSQEIAAYYKEAAAAAKKRKPLNPRADKRKPIKAHEYDVESLESAYLRVRRVTTMSGSEGNLELTPGGDRIIFTAMIGSPSLYSAKWDGSDRKTLRGPAGVSHMSLTGDRVVYVAGGRAGTVKPGGGDAKTIGISASLTIDLEAEAEQKFLETARVLGEQFYHPDMKGIDWTAHTAKYLELARRTRTGHEFTDVGAWFLGELAGSHLGVRDGDPASPIRRSKGRLGIRADRTAAGFVVTEIIPDGPASKGPMALAVGDVITAIDGRAFGATDTLDSHLVGKVGDEVVLDIAVGGGNEVRQALITPTSGGAERQLVYRAWRQRNADLVEQWSDGRLGYIHVQGMNQPSLDVFERDLFAACEGKDGLLIDVRNNGGGWTADRLLASIMVREHAYTISRGADPEDIGHYPQPRLFIQRYTLPANMLCNEKSFSNAEITSHAFKTLGRGTLVGQQTWGGVISTGGFSLIDGTTVRLPFRGWYVVGGMDMENNGAIPDIIVEQTPEAETRGDDEQLRAAVDDLLKRVN